MRIAVRILKDLIPDVCRAFLDDFAIKGPSINYNKEEVKYSICRYIIKYLQNIDKVLVNCELVGVTVSVIKSK